MTNNPIGFYVAVFIAASVPILVFGFWVRRQPWELKDKISAWDPFIKVMAVCGAVIVGLASFERYLDQREQQFLKLQMEKNAEKIATFGQATKAASTIANAVTLESPQEQEAVATFWRLYWGDLARFEGRSVEAAMVRFGRAVQDWKNSRTKPSTLQQLSLQLAQACKKEQEAVTREASNLERRYQLFHKKNLLQGSPTPAPKSTPEVSKETEGRKTAAIFVGVHLTYSFLRKFWGGVSARNCV
jgi:hypothetical protein